MVCHPTQRRAVALLTQRPDGESFEPADSGRVSQERVRQAPDS